MSDHVLSQRELRNRSGEVLRRVADGESFVVTNDGVPVARLVPVGAPVPGLRIARPAKRRGGWSDIARARSATTTEALIDELREDRV